jgi:hypothetical protein
LPELPEFPEFPELPEFPEFPELPEAPETQCVFVVVLVTVLPVGFLSPFTRRATATMATMTTADPMMICSRVGWKIRPLLLAAELFPGSTDGSLGTSSPQPGSSIDMPYLQDVVASVWKCRDSFCTISLDPKIQIRVSVRRLVVPPCPK